MHLIAGIPASYFTGPCLFPGTHKCVYFVSRSLSQAAVPKCSVDTVRHSRADLESQVAEAATKLRYVHSCRNQDR